MSEPSPAVVTLVDETLAEDNRKWAVALADGARVEAVLYRGDSLCVSSQVGCAVACPFCASGANGLQRPLALDELTGQVEAVLATGAQVARVTVSGVGEPLHNHDNVAAFARWCVAHGLGMSLTTSGGPLRRLREWMALPHRGLTLSVHAGTEPVRARMVPNGPRLDPLFEVLGDELPRLSGSRRRKIALAYLLIEGINDGDDEVDAFIERVAPLGVKLHLYAYNPVPTSPLRGVNEARYGDIAARIKRAGLHVRQSSKSRTRENGGCGTLVALRRPTP